jgi:hypothetical protein
MNPINISSSPPKNTMPVYCPPNNNMPVYCPPNNNMPVYCPPNNNIYPPNISTAKEIAFVQEMQLPNELQVIFFMMNSYKIRQKIMKILKKNPNKSDKPGTIYGFNCHYSWWVKVGHTAQKTATRIKRTVK